MISRILKTDVLDFHILEAGTGPLVVLLHGFPDLAIGWTHQIKALSQAGYRVVAPDLRGYGQTGGPQEVTSYSLLSLVGDVVALVEALGKDKAVVIGHDWGAALAWHCALMRPDMFVAVMGISVPYQARRNLGEPTQIMQALCEKHGLGQIYMASFQSSDAHEPLDADPETTLRKIFWGFDGSTPRAKRATGYHSKDQSLLDAISNEASLPPWMTPKHFSNYVDAFTKGGFERPIHWYRNIDSNWYSTRWVQGCKIRVPACFMVGEEDPTRAYMARSEEELAQQVPGLVSAAVVPGAGHWIQQEKPELVNDAILGFLWELSLTA